MPNDVGTVHRFAGSRIDFLADLRKYADRPALISDQGVTTYAELADRIDDVAGLLPAAQTGRRLAFIELVPTVESIATYLAVLAAGHVALVTAPDDVATSRLAEDYEPDLLFREGESVEGALAAARWAANPEPHPDLALLLSTSGSTGCPKLVRLSHRNLDSNAIAIAAALGLTADDRAITSLPLFYCYGLSLLHSHLAVGASLVLTSQSVTDEAFWDLVTTTGVTSIAGVPHSFELMVRMGLAQRDLPSVRRFTQAGGRMSPERVREIASIGRDRGWDLFVMYGQTEATARMAILQPSDCTAYADTVGRAIPGGQFSLDTSVEEAAELSSQYAMPVGELVYRGANVMLGYALARGDLARGRDIDGLRTGDLATISDDGIVRIVGRRNRFGKVLGKRIDLGEVESKLADQGIETVAQSDDSTLDVAIVGMPADLAALRQQIAAATSLPTAAVRVAVIDTIPRLANGKIDRIAVAESFASAHAEASHSTELIERLIGLYQTSLEADSVTPHDSFASLGGDSLSYVEVSVRLEDEIGSLPTEWHHMSIADLAAISRPKRRWASIETSVVLRAVAAITILGTHVKIFTALGGAHALLALAGYNLARFALSSSGRRERVRRTVKSIAAVAVPSVLWIGLMAALLRDYHWSNIALVRWLLGPIEWGPMTYMWFIEAVVWSALVTIAAVSLPMVSRWWERNPFAVSLALVTVGLVPRFFFLGDFTYPIRGLLPFVFWLFAIGLAAATAHTTIQKLIVTAIVPVGIAGFYANPERETYIAVAILAVMWIPSLRMPRLLVPVFGVIASASLYIYLVQFQVYPYLKQFPIVGFAASLAAGLALWLLMTRLPRAVRNRSTRTQKPVKEQV